MEPNRPLASWTDESLFFSSRDFYKSLFEAFDRAREIVRIEVYIFYGDEFGRTFREKLRDLVRRGVRVQLSVDGVGSRGWEADTLDSLLEAGVEARVFRPMPWPFSRHLPREFKRWGRIRAALARLNKRNHKKCFLIDDRIAFVGSMNVHDETFAWREIGARVEGPPVATLVDYFLWSWHRALDPRRQRTSSRKQRSVVIRPHPLIRMNATRKLRQTRVRELYREIRTAHFRVWIVTPYFVPTPGILKALAKAARRGADARLLVPAVSDHPILVWAARLFFQSLMQAGVRIFLYQGRFHHAKMVIVDRRVVIGSTNINHRSFFHDLELDVELARPETLEGAERGFEEDLRQAVELRIEDLSRIPWWGWIQAKIALILKAWL